MPLNFKSQTAKSPAAPVSKSKVTTLVPAPKRTPKAAPPASDLDYIHQTVYQIENAKLEPMHDEILFYADAAGKNVFHIGGRFRRIAKHFLDGQTYMGCSDFKAYIAQHHTISLAFAKYSMTIYTHTVENDIPPEKLAGVDKSKLRLFASLLSPDNVDEWTTKGKTMTVAQIKQEVSVAHQAKKEAKTKAAPPTVESVSAPPTPKQDKAKPPTNVQSLMKDKPAKTPHFTAGTNFKGKSAPPANGVIPHAVTPEGKQLELLAEVLKPIEDYQTVLDVLQARYPDVQFFVSSDAPAN
jgi:hypothetical protein